MRITRETLRLLRLITPRDIARAGPEPRIFIDYMPQDLTRGGHNAKWQVYGVGFKTDPEGHWDDYGNKTFDCWRPSVDKEPQRLAAIAWATKQYGVKEWERSLYGSYHPAGTVAAALRARQSAVGGSSA